MILADTLRAYLGAILATAGAILLIVWLAVVVWAFRDLRSRSRSGVAALLTILLVGLLPIVGLVVYLLLRPRETLAEAYDRALEQEALLQQLEDKPVCPTCSRPTQPNWFLCPSCHTHLRQPCPNCNAPLALTWDICPYCRYLFSTAESDDSGDVATVGESAVEEEPVSGLPPVLD
ncbi:MAG TPA: zinc ribbon domain-containing protein [Promineifilum sp.]|nr:zinc ribbon domain-containing protein [Promineifilum sp.]